ncbi:terpene synthase-like isoform X1 [Epargyreus clarus]|uniref:terpene synthase-like isoform X1 n=1 Tax=Epargyreus clarus TaxID=520877 RepID=UPI003C2B825D
MEYIGKIMQILHTGTLLYDDIQDNSSTRYGVPAAHCVYSLALTINAATYSFAIVLDKILALGHPEAVAIFIEIIIEGHRGQGIDIYWRDFLECPSEHEYMDMIKQKTSFMFILALRLMQLFSDNNANYTKITHLIGIYYQIRDDYCNLVNQEGIDSLARKGVPENSDNNSYCSDITEGKFSLPIIHALKHSEDANKILNILKLRTSDPDLKNYCISILDKAGSFQYTREVLTELEKEIYTEIKALGGNPVMTSIIDALGNWRRDRDVEIDT